MCVCVCVFCCGIWVCSCESLWQHTYTNPPITTLSNNLSSSRWQIHTHIHTTTQNNQILGCLESRVLELQLSLYCLFTWYLNSLPHNSKQQLLLLECGCVGPWKSLLSTLDAQVYLLIQRTKIWFTTTLSKLLGTHHLSLLPPVQTKQNNGCVTTLSGLAILHF